MGIQLVLSKNAENDWTASQNLIVVQPTSQGSPYQNRGWYQDFQVFSDDPAQLPEVDLASAHSLKLFGDPSALDPLSRIEGHNFISAIDRLSTPGFSFPQVTGIRGAAQLKTDTNTGAAGATTVVNLISIRAETIVLGNAANPAIVTNRIGLQIDPMAASANTTVANAYGIKVENIAGATNNFAILTGIGQIQFGDSVRMLKSAGNNFLDVSAPSGNFKFLQISSGGIGRWTIGTNSAAESGGNAGADLDIKAYGDAGVLIDVPISCLRQSGGQITLGGSTARQVVFVGPPVFPTYTVASLPPAVTGKRVMVSNALAPVFGNVVAGGGAVTVPVYYDGAAWRVG